jgi:LPPG:FO 2-phospho-L-lactate transferase
MTKNLEPSIVALAGGVGGAKLADGLMQLIGDRLAVIINTADDFEHLGLNISPDIDTVTYTLAGIANPETGWGIAGESWSFLDQVKKLGGPGWFALGDRDLALHVLRTQRLRNGEALTSITRDIAFHFGIAARLLPMSDDPVHTMVQTEEGLMPFQEYFVGRHCNIATTGFVFEGIDKAQPTMDVRRALDASSLEAVIFCPSNPYVSIAPILELRGMKAQLKETNAPIVAVSPIIGGTAVKGPAAKMMQELGMDPSALAIAKIYDGVIDGLVVDEVDRMLANDIRKLGLAVHVAPTLMRNSADRKSLAATCIDFARRLAGSGVK